MKRFTHSLLATSMIFAATGITAHASGLRNDIKLTEIAAGDYSSRLEYDSYNRLSSVESLASQVTFDYSGATVDDYDYDMTMRISDPSGDIVCYLEIGDNGYISRSREVEEYQGEQAPYKTYAFSYDSEGHLTSVTEIGAVDFSTTEFAYSDGNLVASSTTGNRTSDRTFSYAANGETIANTAGVMDFEAYGLDGVETRYFQYAGLLGTPTADLPVMAESADSEIYVWNTDSEGRPTSLNVFSDNTYDGSTTFAWSGTASAADSIMKKAATECDSYYSINGMRHNGETRGINIIRSADGSVAKTLRR